MVLISKRALCPASSLGNNVTTEHRVFYGMSQDGSSSAAPNDPAPEESLITHLKAEDLRGESGGSQPKSPLWIRTDGQISLQHFRPGTDVSYDPHTLSEYALVVCLTGVMAKTELGHTTVIGPGEAMIGNCGVRLACNTRRDKKSCEAVCLTVDLRMVAPLLSDFCLPAVAGSSAPVFLGKLSSPTIGSCAKDIVSELQGRTLGHEIVLEGLALRILVEALRAWPRARVETCKVDNRPRLRRHELLRAYEFMQWCRKDAFRLEHLCRFLGSSEERFTRLFLSSTGSSPASFYNRMLLEQSRDLLCDPSLSIKEIGANLGFKTTSHFIVAFRRQFGRPPQKYRSALGQGAADQTSAM